MGSMLLLNVFQLIDAFWVGRLGTEALGGLSAATFFVWSLHSIGMLAGTGVNAVVARRVGEGQPVGAGFAATHGLGLAIALGLLTAAVVLPLERTLIGLLDLGPGVQRAALAYLTPVLCGMPIITVTYAMEATFRGSGDTRTPMWVLGGTLALNGVLDPLLIFGFGPVPALGIAGAAWATVAAHGVGVLVGLRLLARREVRPRRSPVRWALIATLVRVGLPIGLTNLLFCVIYIFLTPIISNFGDAPVAAIGVGHRIEGLAYFPCVGFCSAAATLVGQQMGAGRPLMAERAAWLATRYAVALVAGLSLVYFAFAEPIYRIFSADPQVVVVGAGYLRIIALFEVAMALEVVLEGAFSGAGDSVPPMVVGVPLTAARVPAAYLLARRQGVTGIWWAISVSTLLKGAIVALWFRMGRWKRVAV
jgi:putative MATE family efflux protein